MKIKFLTTEMKKLLCHYRGSVRGGAGGSMDPPAFQAKVSLNMKVFALKPNENLTE